MRRRRPTATPGVYGRAPMAGAASPPLRTAPGDTRTPAELAGHADVAMSATTTQLVEDHGPRRDPGLQDPTVRTAYPLAHLFRRLAKYRRPQALEPGLRRADTSGLSALHHVATSLRRDLAAVTAAVAGPWRQGLTEGFNHKIKRTKRLMYGRATFDLLRIRILHAPA